MEVLHDTPFEALVEDVLDCDGSFARVVVLKATFEVAGKRVIVAPEQDPIHQVDQWLGEPGQSSALFESDLAYFKPSSDIVFVGSVHAPRGATSSFPVSIAVGKLRKTAVVFGDRHWESSPVFGVQKSPSRSVSEVPICWERSFGGWDRSEANPLKQHMERRNPIGTGFHVTGSPKTLDGLALPNFENPGEPIQSWKTKPAPRGFGFVGRSWLPRVTYAGTYDEQWRKTRMPVPPRDFNYRFFNGAPEDQVYPGYLRGGELVRAVNFSPAGEDVFELPSLRVRFSGRSSGKPATVEGVLDTAVFALDRRRFNLTWRAKFGIALQERSDAVTAQVDRL
jgi:hypothetical protein